MRDDQSRPANDAYRDGWERCFGKTEQSDIERDVIAAAEDMAKFDAMPDLAIVNGIEIRKP